MISSQKLDEFIDSQGIDIEIIVEESEQGEDFWIPSRWLNETLENYTDGIEALKILQDQINTDEAAEIGG